MVRDPAQEFVIRQSAFFQTFEAGSPSLPIGNSIALDEILGFS
jgi:hypothetical protein